jgi:hypothetical protein
VNDLIDQSDPILVKVPDVVISAGTGPFRTPLVFVVVELAKCHAKLEPGDRRLAALANLLGHGFTSGRASALACDTDRFQVVY